MTSPGVAIREYGGGWHRDKPDPRDILLKVARKRGVNDIDLRDTGFFPPIYQQYKTNACTAMCIGAMIEYMNKKEGKPEFKPSKLFMYWNGRVIDECTDKDDGCEIRDALKGLTRWGVAPDADLPFLVENVLKEPPKKAFEDAQKEIITKYSRVASTLKDITAVLSRGQPIVFGFDMFENLFEDEVWNTGYIKLPKGKHKGGHCMVIVGVQTSDVIIRNSWGTDWGEGGYGYMPLEYIENDNLTGDFWTIDVV